MASPFDLHIHSCRSDGLLDAAGVAALARERGLSLVAIADHDEGAESIALAALAPDIAIAGIELSCRDIDGHPSDLVAIGLRRPLDMRPYWTFAENRTRMVEMWAEVLEGLGWEVPSCSTGDEKRPPFVVSARVFSSAANRERLLALGIGDELAFRVGMLAKGKPADISAIAYQNATPVEVGIAAILAAGGLPILAHPFLGPMANLDFEAHLRRLADLGLAGIEVVHPAHDADTEARLAIITEALGLLVMAGSDTHDRLDLVGRLESRTGIDLDLAYERLVVRLLANDADISAA
jgi:hypothetical protein